MAATEYHDFFPGVRKKVTLDDYAPLLSESNEKRFKLIMLMPLTGTPDTDIPYWVRPAYEKMDVDGSPIKGPVPMLPELEGFTVEAFSTENSQFPIETEAHGLEVSSEELGRRHLLLTGCTVRDFKLVRKNIDGDTFVYLQFSITTKADIALALWLHKYHGGSCWLAFEQPKPDLNLQAKPGEKQMTLSDAAPEKETTSEESAANVKSFFGKSGAKEKAAADCPFPNCRLMLDHDGDHDVVEPGVDEAVAAAKPRRPRGFGHSTGKNVN